MNYWSSILWTALVTRVWGGGSPWNWKLHSFCFSFSHFLSWSIACQGCRWTCLQFCIIYIYFFFLTIVCPITKFVTMIILTSPLFMWLYCSLMRNIKSWIFNLRSKHFRWKRTVCRKSIFTDTDEWQWVTAIFSVYSLSMSLLCFVFKSRFLQWCFAAT